MDGRHPGQTIYVGISWRQLLCALDNTVKLAAQYAAPFKQPLLHAPPVFLYGLVLSRSDVSPKSAKVFSQIIRHIILSPRL